MPTAGQQENSATVAAGSHQRRRCQVAAYAIASATAAAAFATAATVIGDIESRTDAELPTDAEYDEQSIAELIVDASTRAALATLAACTEVTVSGNTSAPTSLDETSPTPHDHAAAALAARAAARALGGIALLDQALPPQRAAESA